MVDRKWSSRGGPRPWSWAVAGWFLGAGCGFSEVPSNSASETEATVHGTVTVRGKPARGGKLTFDPVNIYRKSAPVAKAEIGQDGTYQVRTLLGPNTVRISTPEIDRDGELAGSSAYIEVRGGDNTLDIPLPKP